MIACRIDGIRPLTANEVSRGSWRTEHDRKAELRDLAWADARKRRGRKPTAHGPFTATLVVTPPDRRRRDLDGFAPTLKRMLDGVVLAKIIPDDHAGVVSEVTIRMGEKGEGWSLVLHLDPDPWVFA